MPARKPGGKYRGKITREKGESTIAAELAERARKQHEEKLLKLQERRRQELLAKAGLRSKEDEENEAKMRKLLNMFGSGKAGIVRKFFGNWKVGINALRKERLRHERDTCWKRSCGCAASGPCGQQCLAHLRLEDPEFKMPFEVARRRETQASSLPRSLPALDSAAPRGGSVAQNVPQAGQQQFLGSASSPSLWPATTFGPAGCVRGGILKERQRANEALEDDWKICGKEVARWSDGKRCLLDQGTMRMRVVGVV